MAGDPNLGDWSKKARETLEQGQKIDLLNGLPNCVKRAYTTPEYLPSKQYSSLMDLLGLRDSVIALYGGDQQSKNKTHLLVRTMGGRFSSIEEVEGKVLHSFVKQLGAAKTAKVGFLLAVEFVKKCFTGVSKALAAGTQKGDVAKQSNQRNMRHTGQPVSHHKLIGTTLLVKGLEYEHASSLTLIPWTPGSCMSQ